jgi:YHS domain-containing protein
MKTIIFSALALSSSFAFADTAKPAAAPAATEPAPLAPGTKAKCPVTGEDFTVKAGTAQTTYKGKRYAFCCPDCKPTFEKNPDKYAK